MTAFQIARIIELRSSGWLGLSLADHQSAEDAASELEDEIRANTSLSTRQLNAGTACGELINRAAACTEACLIIIGFDQWREANWKDFDANRGALSGRSSVIILVTAEGAKNLASAAPNIRSFIGTFLPLEIPEIASADPGSEQRLSDLRLHYNLTDDEVVRRAEARQLPANPHFIEWLILLGRGDLV